MIGADIIGALLRGDSDVTQRVPAARIMGARLPDNVGLPALLVRTTSSVERQALRRGSTVITTDRVAVTVRAKTYDDQTEIMDALLRCCAGKTGAIGGGESVAILNAGRSADLLGPNDSFEQTQDFRVTYAKAG